MSKRYPGNFITGNPVALSQTSNNGIWDVTDVSAAVAAGTWQEPDGIHEIGKSLRFRSANSAYLSRTFTTAGNRKTWTWSGWVKRGALGSTQILFGCWTSGVDTAGLLFNSSNNLMWDSYNNGTLQGTQVSSAVFRDPSAWYHVVWSVDTSKTIATNRSNVYINGVEIAYSTNTSPTQNTDLFINRAATHTIGNTSVSAGNYLDGYMAEINFVDGQALDPSYFGYFDPITNIWQPKKYTGAYGTNGFYLPMTDSSDSYTADVLVVAGGGSGSGGGGGGGGVLAPTAQTFAVGRTYTISVGGGGTGGGRGTNSSIYGVGNILTALGGGGGYQSGGSGGGAWEPNSTGGAGTAGPPRQGYNGGNAGGAVGDYGCGGGGGGGGAAGTNGSGTTPGPGGVGYQSAITGTNTYYAGGGGGGSPDGRYPRTTSGGLGGGGTSYYGSADAGSTNTGGGGGSAYPPLGIYGAGGSGVVILRIPTANYTGIVTGSPTVTTDGSFKVVKFTTSGSYTA